MRLRLYALLLFVAVGLVVAQTGPALPKGCSTEDVAKYGRPVMFPAVDGVSFGASVERTTFKKDEPIRVAIWLSNQSRRDVSTGGCSFLEDNIELFDATGHRLSSKAEQADIKLRQEGRKSIKVCSDSLPIVNRRPGFCGVIGGGMLNSEYDLVPGTYTIRHKRTVASSTATSTTDKGISITIDGSTTLAMTRE